MELVKGKKIHFVGIGGIGMCAVAKLMKDKGLIVSGSDEHVHPPASDVLREEGIPLHTPYAASNIPEDVDYIVIGKSKGLLSEINEEVSKAEKMQVTTTSFPKILKNLTKNTSNIVCVGSAGKTTVTGLIAYCLIKAGKDPSFFVGGIPKDIGYSSKLGSGDIFVLEGDEYPTSHEDNDSKFFHYNAGDILLTRMTHDHKGVFQTQEEYSKSFVKLIKDSPGTKVINVSTPKTEALLKEGVITYGFSTKAKWTAENLEFCKETRFTLVKDGREVAEIESPLLGKHNVDNIVGVAALLLEKKYVTVGQFTKAVRTYTGIRNRMDKLTKDSKVSVYEGFGSSLEKTRSAIEALLLYKHKKLVVLFEPSTIDWRMRESLPEYKNAFKGADVVYFYTPALGRGDLNFEEIKDMSEVPIQPVTNSDIHKITKTLDSGDVILTLSSGTIGDLREKLVEWCDKRI